MFVRGLAALLALATAPACLVLSPNEQQAVHVPTGEGHACQLTMTTGLFRSLCGTIELVNTGTAAMGGWRVQFELAPGAELANAWNGAYTIDGQQVTVSPDDPNHLLAPGEAVTLGVCTEAPPQSVRLLPGTCPGVRGAGADDANAPAPILDDKLTQISDAWQVLDGIEYGVGRDCLFQPMDVAATPSGLDVSIREHSLAGPAQSCGAVRSADSYALETLTCPLVAARGSGLVTELSLGRTDQHGQQGVAFYVAGAGQTAWAVSFHDGVLTEKRIDLAFDPTAGAHSYSIARRDGEIAWIIDGVAVASQPWPASARLGGRITLGAWSALDSVWAGTQPEPRRPAVARFARITMGP